MIISCLPVHFATIALVLVAGCSSTSLPSAPRSAAPVMAAPAVEPTPAADTGVQGQGRTGAGNGTAGASISAPASTAPRIPPALATRELVAPHPVRFEDSVARAGERLFMEALEVLGPEKRTVVVDPLIDANTGAQTVSTARMGSQLEAIVKARYPNWSVQPLTRQALVEQPLLLIGTLTPVTIERAIDKQPDAFRVWLTMIDLRSGRVVAKQLDRATVESVNPEPLKYYSDSPTWHKDRTVLGYINSCQVNTRISDKADPDYLARLPAAAVVNEAIMAYGERKLTTAHRLYQEAQVLADPGDLRVLNGLYLTSWQLGQREQARQAFNQLVASGLELKRLPVKILFEPGSTNFNPAGDLPQQYQLWLASLAEQTGRAQACVRIVGHTSRTGSARTNEVLSRQRAEAVQKLIERNNRVLATRLTAAGVGSREALVGLGTDDQRDALDRRVEFRVVDCV